MTAGNAGRGEHGGGNNGSGQSHRAGFIAGGTLAAFVVGGVAKGFGFGALPAAGLGVVAFGLALWLGSMTPAPSTLSLDERARRQRHRSLAIGCSLGALVVIFYVATLVRLGPNALRKDGLAEAGKKTIPITDPVLCKKAGTC
ncbi:MAG: hypothetical protein ABL907_22810 [Hyphomicrobium sp.]